MSEFNQLMTEAKVYLSGKREQFALSYLDGESFQHDVCQCLKDFCTEIEKNLHQVHPGKGGFHTVVHYTSVNVLLSMLKRASKGKCAWLRLYDSVHLNDPDEGNYLARILSEDHSWLTPRTGGCAYLSSFISPGTGKNISNDLVFWRTYGLEGQGCSLSLNVRANRLRKVRYGRAGVDSTQEILDPVLHSLKSLMLMDLSEKVKSRLKCRLTSFVWDSLKGISYLYKDEAYKYEDECRFVLTEPTATSDDNVNFECETDPRKPPRIRHYCNDRDLEVREILTSGSSITLGPCVPYREDVRLCIKALIEKANSAKSLKSNRKLLASDVRFSKIPYRSF